MALLAVAEVSAVVGLLAVGMIRVMIINQALPTNNILNSHSYLPTILMILIRTIPIPTIPMILIPHLPSQRHKIPTTSWV